MKFWPQSRFARRGATFLALLAVYERFGPHFFFVHIPYIFAKVIDQHFKSRGNRARTSAHFEFERDLKNTKILADSEGQSPVRSGNLQWAASW